MPPPPTSPRSAGTPNGNGLAPLPLKRQRTPQRYADWDDRPTRRPHTGEHGVPSDTACEKYPYYAAPCASRPLAPWFPHEGQPASFTKTRVNEYTLLDFNPMLNTSSYVNVVFEPEEIDVANMGLRVNIADQTIYPGSFRLHNDTLNMVADLWHCPKPNSFEEYGCYPGAGTVGSTEACILAGLALKFRWRKWYGERHGLSPTEARRVYPNLVISTCFQACWEKFFRYMDVEPNFVSPSVHSFKLDPKAVAAAVNERTIGVVAILGNHYGGQYDPVASIGAALAEVNEREDWQIGIHVDAASGGFVAPFQSGVPVWDFRVPQVLSISASGHKFGESCCGTGWVVWRDREDLSEHVACNVSYLGGKAESFTLNFSRPASGLFVQFFKFLRLGREGYTLLTSNQMSTAAFLRSGLSEMRHQAGSQLFEIIDDGEFNCLPVVAARFNPALSLPFDAIDLQHVLSERHWYVSGYRMRLHHPIDGTTGPLFCDEEADTTMFRIVVKSNLTRALAGDLLESIENAVSFLFKVGAGYAQMHSQRAIKTHNAPC